MERGGREGKGGERGRVERRGGWREGVGGGKGAARLQLLNVTARWEVVVADGVVVLVQSHQRPLLQPHPLDHDQQQTWVVRG